MTATIIVLFLSICGSTGGELAVARGVQEVGAPSSFRPMAVIRFLGRVLRTRWLIAGIGLMALAFFSLLLLLSWHPVSFVLPATALNYAVGTLGAKFILREQVSASRWAGVLLVCVGVLIVVDG
jgi:drug/metabolite transporter (DMT)-like permease